ncbi:hypothetical protein KSP39_PZI020333 [Platanthera zijinensis]|uniref:Uncharacterized protein n=1 Tax=Platanthera zijinensis TaxID=2320716 RepID=A0AAP0FX54_9ASPA
MSDSRTIHHSTTPFWVELWTHIVWWIMSCLVRKQFSSASYPVPETHKHREKKVTEQFKEAFKCLMERRFRGNEGTLIPSRAECASSGKSEFRSIRWREAAAGRRATRWRRNRADDAAGVTSNLPPGAVIESKSQLVGIRDRVRTDTEVSTPAVTSAVMNEEGKRIFSAANPDAKDAADLLRMCVQCGIPKTYSHARGVVCPVCGDRPLADAGKESEKKKGSTMKDKEKSKRMKGQSSHATWKSETEMHLRQQYD